MNGLIKKGGKLTDVLQGLGMSKAELAKELGLRPNTVYRWSVEKVPEYVWAYLRLKAGEQGNGTIDGGGVGAVGGV